MFFFSVTADTRMVTKLYINSHKLYIKSHTGKTFINVALLQLPLHIDALDQLQQVGSQKDPAMWIIFSDPTHVYH